LANAFELFRQNTQDEKGKESSHLKQNKTKQKRTNQQKEEEKKNIDK
jgi:hypothetical protein